MKKLSITALFSWIFVSIFYAYQYILRAIPNVIIDDFSIRFKTDEFEYSQFSGIYYIGYTLFHIPIGIMLDKLQPRAVLSISIALSAIGLLPLIYNDNYTLTLVGRLLTGTTSCAAILGLFKIIKLVFHDRLFSRMLGISVTIGIIGAIYGVGPIKFMVDKVGYDRTIERLALIGFILALLTYLFTPKVKIDDSTESSTIASLKEVFGNFKLISVCIFAGFMVGPMEGFSDAWGSTFLKNVYKYSDDKAAQTISIIFLGLGIGSPLIGNIAEYFKNYVFTIILCGIFLLISFTLLLNGDLGNVGICTTIFVIGFFSSYQILSVYKAVKYVSESSVGMASAVANMIVMAFGYFFHSLIGAIVKFNGGKESPEGLKLGVSIICIGIIIGIFGFLYIMFKERNLKGVK